MNSRLVLLLEQILDGKPRMLSDLANQLGMTTRALKYHIRSINAFLLREDFSQIEIHRSLTLSWSISPSEAARLQKILTDLTTETFQLVSEERQSLITLILMASDQNPVNETLAKRLGVSKSTIDKDIQRLTATLQLAGITLNRHIRKGCQLIAEECVLRNHCYKLILDSLDFYNPLQISNQAINPKEKIVRELFFANISGPIFEILHKAEADLLRKEFSIASSRSLLLHLIIAVVRIRNGHILPDNNEVKQELRKSKEYMWAINICLLLEKEFEILIPESEKLNIAFLLSSVHFANTKRDSNEDWTEIQILIRKMIQGMSRLMGVDFSRDESLSRALDSHLSLTTFYVKNQLPIVNPALEDIKRYYPYCFESLRKVVTELEEGMELGISDDEIGYLVLHFSASLERQKRMLPSAKVAIVCIHGAGTASLLRERLVTRFPNLRVVAVPTVSDLDLIQDLDVDFIVSTIRLPNSKIPYLKVDPLPTESDLAEVGKMLIKYVDKGDSQSNTQDLFHEIVASIGQLVPNEEKDKFLELLASKFDQHGFPVRFDRKTSKLSDLLTVDKIQCGLEASDWQSAVMQTAEILHQSGDITLEFIDSAIKTVSSAGPYIVICRGVALVHSAIGVGVNELAMSLATFPKGVSFNHPLHDPVRVIFCLAPIDNESHLEALHGIIDLFDNTNELELVALNSPVEIHKRLQDLGI